MKESTSHPTGESDNSAPIGAPILAGARWEFLDALRGIAALFVAIQHCVEMVSPSFLKWSVEVWRPGEFGVVLFFICSGFIIPASLEKHGSMSRFWITRFFRLYPLYLTIMGIMLMLHYFGNIYPLDAAFRESPMSEILINMTMVQFFLNHPMVVGASWTMSYELIFYMGCSLLFFAGIHRRSTLLAFVVICAAGGSGGLLPAMIFTNGRTWELFAFAVFSIILCSGLVIRRAPAAVPVRISIVTISALMLGLVLNRWHPAYLFFAFLSAMFVGTVFYRYVKGDVSSREMLAIYLFSAAVLTFSFWLNIPDEIQHIYADALHTWRPEAATFIAAFLVFGGAVLLRNLKFPRWLTFLGTISYSVYLTHALLIHIIPRHESPYISVFTWLSAILAASIGTYYLVELPAQKLGHKIARWVPLPLRPS